MIIVDVDLLLYAVVTAFRQHEPAREWFERAVNDGAPVCLPAPAVFGFPDCDQPAGARVATAS